jgi:hypothetical protein
MSCHISKTFTRHVHLQNYSTQFWRYQSLDMYHLSTIEAIYYFYKEFIEKSRGKYEGEVDLLLFYFYLKYECIQAYYKERPELKFCKKKLDSETYIQYEEGGQDRKG